MKSTLFLMCVALLGGSPALGAENKQPGASEAAELEHGGFGGPSLGAGQVLGELVPLVGGKGGWIIDHRLVLGASLAAVPHVGSWPSVRDAQGQMSRLGYWQGGLWLEYLFRPQQRLHYSLGAALGAGYLEGGAHRAGVLVPAAEPTASAGIAFTRFFQADLAVGYRLTAGSDAALDGPTATLQLRFGSF